MMHIEGIPDTPYLILSCLSPDISSGDYLFGDYIPFEKQEVGPFKQSLLESLRKRTEDKQQVVVMIFPQRPPQFSAWQNSCFHYIELPEFYGAYWDFYSHRQCNPTYDPYNVDAINKHFMFLAKRITTVRCYLFHDLYANNLMEKGHVSFLSEYPRGQYPNLQAYQTELENLNNFFLDNDQPIPFFLDSKFNVKDQLPIQTSPLLEIKDSVCLAGGWLTDTELFASSFVNVVSETFECTPGSMVFTEKIFKVIYHKRPFFLLGSRNSLVELRSLGFKTFDQWFDESYDFESSPFKKAEMISAELKRLCDMPLSDIRQMMLEMRAVCDYNFERLKSMSDQLPGKLQQIDRWIIDKFDQPENSQPKV